jgi:hypothetical protein
LEKIGRNDKCPCGSGLKYKKCHGTPNATPSGPRPLTTQSLSLRERNLVVLNAVADIFDLAKANDWGEVKRRISDNQVRELYEVVARLWPPDTDLVSLLPTPGSSLRALYMGDIDPSRIVRNVFRFSLYADEILVIDPFHNPWMMAEEYNPIVNPGQWRADTLKLILFTVLIAPWVESGLVSIVPNPAHFDLSLRRKTEGLAAQRLRGWAPSDEDMEDFEPAAQQEFARMFYALPKEALAQKFRESSPQMGEQKVKEMLAYVDMVRARDPLDLEQPIDNMDPQIVATRTGTNLEMGLYVSHLTGAFPYTSLRMRWRELMSAAKEFPESAMVWSPLTKAFQDLEFKFIDDNVDSQFACMIRKDGRLEPFRAFLRRLWSSVGGNPDIDKASTLARDFGDELAGEYSKAEAEWAQIDRDLVKQFGATLVGGLIGGAFSPFLSTLGFAATGVLELLNAQMQRREFRKKIPMSVFIDLSAHKKRER